MLIQGSLYLWGLLYNVRTIYGVAAVLFLLPVMVIILARNGNVSTTHRKLKKNHKKQGESANNMEDQYHPMFGLPADCGNLGLPRIKALYLHPVKSCAPIEVESALLTKTGFLFDRCFAFATGPLQNGPDSTDKWRFISQRTKPAMSMIETEIWLPTQGDHVGHLAVMFPSLETPTWADRLETLLRTWDLSAIPKVSFSVPLDVIAEGFDDYVTKPKTFTIHSREAMGLDMGELPRVAAAMPKLKKFLKIPDNQGLSLFRCTEDTLVRTDKNLAPLENIGTPAVHGYTDQQPLNINSLSSVHAVSALLPAENQPLNALRFRANIWIENSPAYDEETWKRCTILPKDRQVDLKTHAAPTLSVVCRTSRCTMPNVDPEKGVFDTDNAPPGRKKGKPQPSTTLVQHRTVEDGNKMALGYLGMHCVPEDWCLRMAEDNDQGLYVRVGDEIEVLERGTHLYGSTAGDY
ncbi:hypothetical protein N7533_005148 [Penicillium manginii]|uniref:uncharacterized protein n=1 Tax=Penicillium manginii TaxID=203109 RepID=UPI0025480ED2|nr:uncharacterized protein N7533_005148 [Penicillium manginii]KAJ5755605.1 hypothetical protein N7533_005148 [Penicillium manginii]